MSDIINAAESLQLDRASSIAQVKSQGGRRSAQKRGPTLYNLEVKVPVVRMNDTKHRNIENEILALEYGAKTFDQAGISGRMKADTITKPNGIWVGTPVINGASQTGNTINVSGLTPIVSATSFEVGVGYEVVDLGTTTNAEWNAIAGTTSVNYTPGEQFTAQQVGTGTGTASDIRLKVATGDFVQFQGSTKVYQLMYGSTNTTLKLNCPVVTAPTDGSSVTFGNHVDFNFCLKDHPTSTYLPGDIVEFGTFYFEEVIE